MLRCAVHKPCHSLLAAADAGFAAVFLCAAKGAPGRLRSGMMACTCFTGLALPACLARASPAGCRATPHAMASYATQRNWHTAVDIQEAGGCSCETAVRMPLHLAWQGSLGSQLSQAGGGHSSAVTGPAAHFGVQCGVQLVLYLLIATAAGVCIIRVQPCSVFVGAPAAMIAQLT